LPLGFGSGILSSVSFVLRGFVMLLRIGAMVLVGSILGGCSGIEELGEINGTKFYSVHADEDIGPNFTAMVTAKEGEDPQVHAVLGGPGWAAITIPAILGAAGDIGGPALNGLLRRPNKTNIHVSGIGGHSEAGSSSSSSSEGGDAFQAQGQLQLQGQHQEQSAEAYARAEAESGVPPVMMPMPPGGGAD